MESLVKDPIREEPVISKQEARDVIGQIISQVGAMGANDYEIPTLNGILENLRQGLTTPDEAVADARRILNSKQDYH